MEVITANGAALAAVFQRQRVGVLQAKRYGSRRSGLQRELISRDVMPGFAV